MRMKKLSIKKLFIAIFGGFFMLLSLSGVFSSRALATEEPAQTQTQTETKTEEQKNAEDGEDFCETALGKLSWRLCPDTEKASNAADWLYEKIEDVLVINPVAAKDGEPIYEIWKYCRDIANIVFIIFLIIITYSQITGMGINNYGIKKALPKLIVAAVLVNLSFIICSLAVDASNIIGTNIRGLFTGIESGIAASKESAEAMLTYTQYFDALKAGGIGAGIAALAVTIESGTLWMLIPTVLASLAAVVIGLITVAMRQAVVVLLVMVAPLAIVAYILPNTEDLFKRWKKIFTKMLVFFPLMGLLFGASNLAGWALIHGAQDGFMLLLGKAVQFLPLFLAFKMMKMPDTILGTVSGKLSSMVRPLIASNTAWASSHRDLTRSKALSHANPYTPYARLTQFLNNRRIAREADTAGNQNTAKLKGLAYKARRNYKGRGLSRAGKGEYAQQAYDMRLNQEILNDKNNFNEGFSARFAKGTKEHAEMLKLDMLNVNAADDLYAENVRAAAIDFHNAKGRHKRFEDAFNANLDEENRFRKDYEAHIIGEKNTAEERKAAMDRYARINGMFKDMDLEKNYADTAYVAAEAAAAFNAQSQVRQGKYQKWFDMTVPTQDVVNRLHMLTSSANATENMEAIIAGCRTLNMRGDGKLLREAIESLTSNQKLEVGTAAAQALAGFLMFEVKDNDPFLRRFGKYINLETARYYNGDKIDPEQHADQRRKRRAIDLKEYVRGEYQYIDENGEVQTDKNIKRDMTKLLMGTSFKGVEREAYLNILEGVQSAYKGADGKVANIDMAKMQQTNTNVLNSILANVVGDQFNYASGSEQINALAKFITAIKVKYKDGKASYEWDDDTLKLLSNDEKEAKSIAFDRTKEFLSAQVPNQIAKSKTDVLYAMQQLFDFKATDDYQDANSKSLADFRKEEAESGFKVKGDVDEKTRYSHWLFRSAMKKATRGGVAKTIARGFQGDTKENLLKAMGYDDYEDNALISQEIEKYAPNVKHGKGDAIISVEEEEEEEDDYDTSVAEEYLNNLFDANRNTINANNAANSIESIYNGFVSSMSNPNFRLSTSQKQQIIDLRDRMSTYSDTSEIFKDINDTIHGNK